ncbi:MAG: hypothetical protein QXU99_03620 [Candidatus Bathyarchaeia archaeon]
MHLKKERKVLRRSKIGDVANESGFNSFSPPVNIHEPFPIREKLSEVHDCPHE